MAHFAELDANNIVQQVIVVHNNELLDENNVEQEQKGVDFCVAHYGGNWIQTSYNGTFRKNFAGQGFIYDRTLDAFIQPQPFASWILNENNCVWEPPVPAPINPYTPDQEDYWLEPVYVWNENNLAWEIQE